MLLHQCLLLRTGFLLSLLFCWATAPLQAQNKLMLHDTITDPGYFEQRGDWFRVRPWGLAFSTMRDQALSPLLYAGSGIVWGSNTYKFKPRTFVHRQWQFNSLSYTNLQSESLLAQLGIEYQHALHYPIALANDNVKLYAGGFAGGLFNLKVHPENVNNVLSYELAVLLGPSGMVQFPLTVFGKRFVLSDELRFPLMSLLGNTPYAWPLPTAFEEGGTVGDAFRVGSWGKFFRVSNQVNVDFHRNVRRRRKVVKRLAYRVGYRWELVSVAEPNLYQSGTHTISIARIITL
jgi:hypothetical protein